MEMRPTGVCTAGEVLLFATVYFMRTVCGFKDSKSLNVIENAPMYWKIRRCRLFIYYTINTIVRKRRRRQTEVQISMKTAKAFDDFENTISDFPTENFSEYGHKNISNIDLNQIRPHETQHEILKIANRNVRSQFLGSESVNI
jgi:hypothetical protein